MPQTLLLSTSYRNHLPIWHKFKLWGGGGGHCTQYTHLAGPFEFCFQIFGQLPTLRKALYHSLPLPHLVYTYHCLFLGRNALTGRMVLKVRACVTTEPGQDTSTGLRAAAPLMHVTGVLHCKDTIPKVRNKFPEKELLGLSPHSCVCERFLYSNNRCLLCCRKYVDHKSLTDI